MAVSHPDDEEAPLDPAVERIRVKLARLLIGSIGVMVLGLLAVLLAILYKLGALGETGRQTFDAVAELPAGAQVLSSALSDGTLAVTVRLPDGEQEVRFFRMPEATPAGRVRFAAPKP